MNPARSTIVKYDQSTSLTVLKGDRTIEADVSAVQIAIWNRGKQSVRPVNVLSPIIVSRGNANGKPRILEASIRKVTRNLVGLRLDNSKIEQGEIRLEFDILERDDGGIVQVIYEGTPEANFSVTGTLEKQGNL